jgi:hypothetical protein
VPALFLGVDLLGESERPHRLSGTLATMTGDEHRWWRRSQFEPTPVAPDAEPGSPHSSPFRPPEPGSQPGEGVPGTEQADGPILYWFIVSITPQGGAPEEVRAQWNGVALPVRRPRPIEGPSSFRGRRIGAPEELLQIDDGVPVYLADALTALRHFDRELARSWWRDWFDRNPHRRSLVFRIHEGTLLPVGFAVVRYPELADFDSW